MSTRRSGLTLFETLLSLALFTAVILGGFDFFSRTRRMFFRLRSAQDVGERVQAALDRMRLDIREAGLGLADPVRREIIQAVEMTGDGPVFLNAETSVRLAEDAPAGAVRIRLTDGDGFSAGREACLLDGTRCEKAVIGSADGREIVLSTSLRSGFAAADTSVLLVRRVSYPPLSVDGVLKRKVNASPAQPLLEDVAEFLCTYDRAANLARIMIRPAADPENEYAITIFPKNAALARADRRP
jgi:Tfp pilus assembly protein PilW